LLTTIKTDILAAFGEHVVVPPRRQSQRNRSNLAASDDGSDNCADAVRANSGDVILVNFFPSLRLQNQLCRLRLGFPCR